MKTDWGVAISNIPPAAAAPSETGGAGGADQLLHKAARLGPPNPGLRGLRELVRTHCCLSTDLTLLPSPPRPLTANSPQAGRPQPAPPPQEETYTKQIGRAHV